MTVFRSNRGGFALPFALLVIGVLSIGAATLLARGDVEGRINRDREARMDAFAIAQTGLELFAKNRESYGFTTKPPLVSESTRIALPGGYADVILTQVRLKAPNADALYLLRSRGTRQAGGMAWNADAKQTVAQYTFWREGSMQIVSSWTSLTGIVKNGGAGVVTGFDACATAPNVNGVAVPNNGYVQNGGSLVPIGVPNDTLYMGTQAQMSNDIKIDWNGILNENLIIPDLVIPGDSWPTSFADPTYWPTIRINGDLTLTGAPGSGRGLLIITGNLYLSGNINWDGVILVGGKLDSEGNNTILGAVITGLDVKLGLNPPPSSIGNGSKTFRYDSCKVAQALSNNSKLLLIPNAWSDNWAW